MLVNLLKKLFRIAVLVLVFMILLVIAKSVFIMSANSDYKNKKYESAIVKYELLLKLEPKDRTYLSNYANCLVQVPFTYENQKKIADFLEQHKGESYAYSLEQRLAKYKANMDLKIGANYIYKALYDNKVLHWEYDAFPLKVYIPDTAIKKPVKAAFDYWTYATSNFVSFTYVNRSDNANIRVEVEDIAKTNCIGEDCSYSVAVTMPEVKNNILKFMTIKFNERDPFGTAYTYDQMYRIALHEIGHALGIIGHSDNPSNLMYASGSHDSIDFQEYHSALAREDINTLNILYIMAPDISNVPSYQRDLKNKIYPAILIGTEKEIRMRNILDAKNYIANAPNLAVGYIDLGNAYFQSDMYDAALNTYTQAMKLSVDRDEKYIIAYNIANVFLKLRQPEKALEYAKYAQQLNPTDEINKFVHDIEYPLSILESNH